MKDYLKPYTDAAAQARDRAEEVRQKIGEMQNEIDLLEQAAKETDDYALFLENENKAKFLRNRLDVFKSENKEDFSFDFSGIIDEIRTDHKKELHTLYSDFVEDYTRMKENFFRHLEEIDNMRTALKEIERHQPHGFIAGFPVSIKHYIENGAVLEYQARKE